MTDADVAEASALAPASDAIAQQIECAWCKTVVQEGALPVSHGICEKCSQRFQEAGVVVEVVS